jgi:hypothetical protein
MQGDHYLALLRRNYIWNPASVMYRRAIFDRVPAFDQTVNGCEDYDLYLRITREFPIYCHDKAVAQYRMHSTSLSRNSARMLRTVMKVMQSQGGFLRGKPYKAAHRAGIKFWRFYYGNLLVKKIYAQVRRREGGRQVWQDTLTLARHYLRGLVILGFRLGLKSLGLTLNKRLKKSHRWSPTRPSAN